MGEKTKFSFKLKLSGMLIYILFISLVLGFMRFIYSVLNGKNLIWAMLDGVGLGAFTLIFLIICWQIYRAIKS